MQTLLSKFLIFFIGNFMLCTVFALVQVFQQGGIAQSACCLRYFFGFKTGKYEIKA